MHRIFIGIVLFMTTFFAQAQEIADNTIGLRFGDDDGLGAEISYQKAISEINRIEAGLAWRNGKNYNAFKLTGTYQWVFPIESISGMNWYVGAGGGLGSWSAKSNYTGESGTFLFAAGDIGLEYKFEFPLLISLDFRPELGFVSYNNDLGLDFAFGARYVF